MTFLLDRDGRQHDEKETFGRSDRRQAPGGGSRVDQRASLAITSLAESMTCLIGLLGYIVAHLWLGRAQDWSGASLSVPMATLTVRAVPSNVMRACVGVATCLLGVPAMVWLLVG